MQIPFLPMYFWTFMLAVEDRGKQNTETVSSSWGRLGWIFVSPVMASYSIMHVPILVSTNPAWWGTRSGHRYYILLFNIPDISSASSSLPVSSLRVNEEGNCSESVLESREPGGEQFQDTGIIFLFSTYRVFLLTGPTLKITSMEKS